MRGLSIAAIRRSRTECLPDAVAETLPPALRSELDAYARYDAAARRMRWRAQWALHGIVLAMFAAMLGFQLIESSGWRGLPLGKALYFFGFGMAVQLHAWSAGRRWQERHLTCRAVAEALRVDLYWALAGLCERPVDHYCSHHRKALGWVAEVVTQLDADLPERIEPERVRRVCRHWLEAQRSYYTARARTERRRAWWTERTAGALILVAGVAAWALDQFGAVFGGWSRTVWQWSIHLLPISGGLIWFWGDRMGWREQSQRYARMAQRFDAALGQVASLLQQEPLDAETEGALRQVLFEIGRDALWESAEWLLQHRARPIELPLLPKR